MKKRILAVVLCLAMLLSVVPFTLTASAADDGSVVYMNVPDTAQWLKGYNNYTGWAAKLTMLKKDGVDPLAKDKTAADYDDGGSGGLYVVVEDNEGYLVYNPLQGTLRETGNNAWLYAQRVNAMSTSTTDTGLAAAGVDKTKVTHLAVRLKVKGEDGNQLSSFGLYINTTHGFMNIDGAYLIDAATGKVTTTEWSTAFNFTSEFDGWVVFPIAESERDYILNTGTGFGIYMHDSKCSHGIDSSWDKRNLLLGDILAITDISKFNLAHGTPVFSLEAGETTITVVNDDANAVYSLDKDAAADKWLAKDAFNATLTNLNKDTKYTVYAKYATGTTVASLEIWTSPYGTHKGDGASYLLNVHDDATANPYICYQTSISPNGRREMGWPNGGMTYNEKGEYSTSSGVARMFIREIDGETFIEVNREESVDLAKCANQGINVNAITYNGTVDGANGATVSSAGLHSSIDKTNLTHLAIRLKVDELVDGASQRSGFYLYIGGKNAQKLKSGSYMIDKKGVVTPYTESDSSIIITGEFDGWLVIPFTAYSSDSVDGKKLITTDYANIQPYFHGTSCHESASQKLEGWGNKILYLGDMVVFGDEDLFKSVHVCGAAGHVEGTAATCKDKATCSVCKQPYGDVNPTKHGTNTELRDVVKPDCKNDGYTGDTWCKDCNTKIADGKLDPATGAHVDADGKWETDGANHWHTCGCGTEFDKNAHTGGTATCKDKKVCDTCKAAYGEVDANAHGTNTELKGVVEAECGKPGYTGDTWCKDCNTEIAKGKATDALTHKGGEATCKDKAICDLCKEAYGEVNAENHKNTELKNKKDATCAAEGYTGDTYCKDCEKEVKKGEAIKKLDHVAADELKDAKPATTTEKGYTGDKVCKDCGEVLEKGKEIPVIVEDDKTEDDKTEGDSTTGGEGTDNDNAGAGSEDDGTTAPETGDSTSVLVAVLAFLVAGAVVVLAKKRA